MYSIYVVEDEHLIREGIRKMIQWEQLGFEYIGDAADGESAWIDIKRMKPDIIITDIKMPFLDGLALSRLIRESLPDSYILIVSGYDDFAYAKEAIGIGVNEFLLKPVSKKELESVLMEIYEKKERQKKHELPRETMNTLMRRDLFDDIVANGQAVQEILESAKALNIDLAYEAFNFVVVETDGKHHPIDKQSAFGDLLRYLEKNYEDTKNVICFSISPRQIVLLVKGSKAAIESLSLAVYDTVCTYVESIDTLENCYVAIGVSVERLRYLGDSYQSIRQAILQRSIETIHRLNYIDLAHPIEDVFTLDPEKLYFMEESVLTDFIKYPNHGSVGDFVDEFIATVGDDKLNHFPLRQYLVMESMFSVAKYLKREAQEADYVEALEVLRNDARKATRKIESFKQYFCDLLSLARFATSATQHDMMSETVVQALKFIDDHFTDSQINLKEVADAVHLTPSHFSALFSKEVGVTFIKYLTDLRINKAKELLNTTRYKSSAIAEKVGYNDAQYFSSVFKKNTGHSPRDYRFGSGINVDS